MKKYLNPVFIGGVVVTILLAAGIDPETLKDWELVGEAFLSIVLNPYKLFMVLGAVYAMFNNNDTKKLDNPFKL